MLFVVALAPPASAHAADVFLIPFVPAPALFPPPTMPPSFFLPPVTVTDITAIGLAPTLGAGVCNVAGEACFAWPAWNPVAGAPATAWACQHTGGTLFPGTPGLVIHLVQSFDDVLDAGDVTYSLVAPGPLPPFPGGAFGGDFFAPFGPLAPPGFFPGMPVHVVPTMGGLPLLGVDLVITCWVF